MKSKNLALATLLACGLAAGTPALAGSLSTQNAKLEGKTLTLDVTSPQAGWAVIHAEQDNKPGAHLGHAQVKEGENKSVSINLSEAPQAGSALVVMLHEDDGVEGAYEFGDNKDVDKPVMKDNEAVTVRVTP